MALEKDAWGNSYLNTVEQRLHHCKFAKFISNFSDDEIKELARALKGPSRVREALGMWRTANNNAIQRHALDLEIKKRGL
jgi:hypothetical protein